MKFSKKMSSQVVLMAVMISFIALIGFFSLSRLSTQLNEITNRALPLSHLLESIRNRHTEQSLWLYQALLDAELVDKEKFTTATDSFNELIGTIDKQFTMANAQINAILNETQSKDDRNLLTSFLEQLKLFKIQHDDYVVLGGNVLFTLSLGDMEEAEASIQEIKNQTHELNKNITTLNSQIVQFVNRSASLANDNAKYAMNSIAFFTLLALALSLLISFLIVSSITRQLGSDPSELLNITEDLADGKLKINAIQNVTGVNASIRKTVNVLNDILTGIKLSAKEVFTAAEQVSLGNMDLSQRTQEQASSLEEVSSSMEQMTSSVNQNAENAMQANNLAQEARLKAEQGGKVASQAVTAMNDINDASNKIANIINVINDIAFQTHLLALNAAVEAARAGEQGRGFAVVAHEVRNLAGRCQTSAKEIEDLLKDNVIKIQDGTNLVDKSNQTLDEIVLSANKVSNIVEEIAVASQEQSDGIAQVNQALLQMDDMTQHNASLVEQSAAASKAMGDQAEQLNTLVDYFTVDNDDHNQNILTAEDNDPNNDIEQGDRHPLLTAHISSV